MLKTGHRSFGGAAAVSQRVSQRVLGLDVGGANLKAATSDGHSLAVPFPLWLRPDQLADQLTSLAAALPTCQAWAVTMTGELADVFLDRSVGVRKIVEQTTMAANRSGIDDVRFYSVNGRFLSAIGTVAEADAVASANWHALASWVAGYVDAPSLLIDVGSTTTDMIAIEPGRVVTDSRTDFDRLVSGELVYLGGGRTPVCALVERLPFQHRQVPVMREVFATTDDCALVLAMVEEEPEDHATSDGGPRTVAAAVNRLGRMIGLDHRHVDHEAAKSLARAVIAAAADSLAAAIASHRQPHISRWIVCGHTVDYFLPALTAARDTTEITRLSDWLSSELSRIAPAFACARLRHDAIEAETISGS